MKEYSIIKKIKETAGRNDKELIISQNKTNENFKQLLIYAFDPYIVFGVAKKKLAKFAKKATGENNQFHDIYHLLRYLTLHNTGSDATLKMVSEFLATVEDKELREFFEQVITKSLTIGANVKSINKGFGKQVIREFNVLLAKKFEDEQHKVEGKEFTITEKLDGMRVILLKNHDSIKFFSRQGQPILGLNEIIEDALKLDDGAYDGELLIHNADDYKDRDVLQETLKIARKDGDKEGLILHLFDMLPIEQFEKGKSSKIYKERKRELIYTLDQLDLKFIKYVPNLYQGKDMSVIPELLDEMDSKGKEGLMVNVNSGLWTGKRSDQLLKVKSMQTMDVMVIGFEEGKGKYKGMLGKLIVDYKGFELGVGTKLSDHDCEYIWNNKDEYLGRVIEVGYFRESKNDKGGLSVSFPVYKGLREEGKEVSYY